MAYDENLAQRVRSQLKGMKIHFEEKRMMGGLCFMVSGKMCVGVENDRLMARIDPAVYEEALARTGCVPMDFTGRPMRGFIFVNSQSLKSPVDLKFWLQLALEFNPKAVPSKKRTARNSNAAKLSSRKKIGLSLNKKENN